MMSKIKIIGAGSAVTAFAAGAVALYMHHSNAIETARIEGRQEAVSLYDDTITVCATGNQVKCGNQKMNLLLMSMGAKVGL